MLLNALAISGPRAPALGFQPGTLAYNADVSILQQSTRVTATAMSAEASIDISGVPAESGVPGPELPLGLGDNAIDITVTHPLAGQRVYRVTVRRAAQIAQVAYGKASNTDAVDFFGISVALSGDTLAVGAYYEDSAATGINGDPADNSASQSGAVYIFH